MHFLLLVKKKFRRSFSLKTAYRNDGHYDGINYVARKICRQVKYCVTISGLEQNVCSSSTSSYDDEVRKNRLSRWIERSSIAKIFVREFRFSNIARRM